VDDQFFRGQAAERRRVTDILLNPAAEGRERAAIALAIGSTLSVSAAVRTLGEIAKIDEHRAAAGPDASASIRTTSRNET
jgi:hypothetical protein